MLRRAHVSPKPTAALFRKLSDEAGEDSGFSAEFLQSHPMSSKRAGRFAASFDPKGHYAPVISRDERDALFDICRGAPEKRFW
jgi:hypothetical protein